LLAGLAAGLIMATAGTASAATLPEIRVSERSRVPACVTPQKLMRYLQERNPRLLSQFDDIAAHYKEHGERWGVRWDYAFFQMLLETNNLRYTGTDRPRQNNFAGLGTTGGGVKGNAFPDVTTGVLAQIQHLVAYSGEKVPTPVAPRTRDNQDDIIRKTQRLDRPMRFSDLTNRWAMDRGYAKKIEAVAEGFFSSHCRSGRDEVAKEAPARLEVPRPIPVHSGRLTDGDGAGATE
jgi:hypothetical protein